MIRVVLPDTKPRRLAFFLAMEEWVARNLPAEKYFFSWVVNPTVIIGRNQDLQSEVNLAYCQEHDIEIVRRRSGGGAVYADRHNIMLSYVTDETDVEKVFADFTGLVAKQLRRLGFDAYPSGRNDITIGDRKISGNAFYLLSDRSIVHGTMLFDTDIVNMLNAITPSRAKLESHKVTSVAARIVTASELHPELSFEQFHDSLTAGLENGRVTLSQHDIAEIEKIENNYYKKGWLENGLRDSDS